jgi:hypothetical protein
MQLRMVGEIIWERPPGGAGAPGDGSALRKMLMLSEAGNKPDERVVSASTVDSNTGRVSTMHSSY